MTKRSFTVSRFFNAPPALVFSAWTDPDRLGWFYNPSMPTPDERPSVDLRVGGAWRQLMVIDAETQYVTGGIYREIVPGRRLVFSWGAVGGWPALDPERLELAPLATVEFTAESGGTRMVCRLDLPEGIDDRAAEAWLALGVEAGWTATIGRLAL